MPTSTSSRSANALKIFQDSSLLDDISVASPCHAEWNDMVGSETVRFCASCQKNVFNLSGMKRDDAIDLLRATEGRMCIRFYRRADGTVLTEDCPVGVQLLLRRAKRATLMAAAVSVGAVAALVAVLGGSFAFTKKTCQRLDDVKTTIESVIPDVPTTSSPPLMGAPPAMPPQPTMGEPPAPIEIKGDMKMPEMGKRAPPTTGTTTAPTLGHKTMGAMIKRAPKAGE